MLVWAIASQKGGVGKTTTVASLAGWLQKEHLRVLVIDTDPHASLTSYLGFEDETLDNNLYDLYSTREMTKEKVLSTITHTRFQGLDIIASTMTLATIDRQLSGRMGVGRILAKSLKLIEDCYDVVLIDCPPVLGALMVNALVASSIILVPTQTEFLALKGLEGMVRTFHIMHNADQNYNINYLIVPTMFDKRTKASLNSLEHLRAHYHKFLWQGMIPIDTLFRESSQRGLPIPIMNEDCRGAVAYRELLLELIKRELSVHPESVTPATAAILTIDDESGEIDSALPKTEDDPLSKDMGAMLGEAESEKEAQAEPMPAEEPENDKAVAPEEEVTAEEPQELAEDQQKTDDSGAGQDDIEAAEETASEEEAIETETEAETAPEAEDPEVSQEEIADATEASEPDPAEISAEDTIDVEDAESAKENS